MIIEFEWRENALVSRIKVLRLDASVAGELKRELIDRLQRDDAQLLINLREVEFMDSTGLGALISVLKHAPRRTDIGLCEVRPPVLQLLKLTRMDRVMTIWATESAGIAALNDPHEEGVSGAS